MAKSGIGETIAKYRKLEGITQEELGRAVGVSTQAVSRWECGGTPDVELLPAIADRLHVTVDELFGRMGQTKEDLQKQLRDAVGHTRKEDREKMICECIWTMQRELIGLERPEIESLGDVLTAAAQHTDRQAASNPEQMPKQVLMSTDSGFFSYGFTDDMRYALVLPEAEGGFSSMLKETAAYRELFSMLAKEHYLEMMEVVHRRGPMEYFTDRLAAAELHIPLAQARAILDDLSSHCLLERMEAADTEGMLVIYYKESSVNWIQFLFFAGQLMESPDRVVLQAGLRCRPALENSPGTGNLTPQWNLRGLDKKQEKPGKVAYSSHGGMGEIDESN